MGRSVELLGRGGGGGGGFIGVFILSTHAPRRDEKGNAP